MRLMGLNGKQVSKAGDLIGMGRSTALLCHSGERRLTKTEKLAMAAVVAEMAPWSAGRHPEIHGAGKVMAAVHGAFLHSAGR